MGSTHKQTSPQPLSTHRSRQGLMASNQWTNLTASVD